MCVAVLMENGVQLNMLKQRSFVWSKWYDWDGSDNIVQETKITVEVWATVCLLVSKDEMDLGFLSSPYWYINN
jgi:hypothetical protein